MEKQAETLNRIASFLRRAGMNMPAAFLLEAAGPLMLIGAQAAFLLEPLFGIGDHPLGDLARFLEDPDQVSDFVERLREEEVPC